MDLPFLPSWHFSSQRHRTKIREPEKWGAVYVVKHVPVHYYLVVMHEAIKIQRVVFHTNSLVFFVA